MHDAMLIAQQRIAAAVAEGGFKLDLVALHLSELPADINILTELRILFLDLNALQELDEVIGTLRQLEELVAYNNKLTAVTGAIGNLTRLKRLDLRNNLLVTLPESIGDLGELRELILYTNKLASLPGTIGKLASLITLDVLDNQLTTLPVAIGSLRNLRVLRASLNRLESLPSEIGALRSLEHLYLSDNSLATVPSEIGKLDHLVLLDLSRNRLTSLPPEVGQLRNLTSLRLDGNQLNTLPAQLADLPGLSDLDVSKNPLNEMFKVVVERGPADLFAYLRSLREDGQPLYEAKLVFVGEGQVGKTSLLHALRGDPFVENRATTHGLEIAQLQLPHPDHDEMITLNAWDFGGQPVYRVTHQFFFSVRSVYLLCWSPRLGVEQCDVEGWVKRIRLRVGPEARIIIVATHCNTGGRVARIDQRSLLRYFGDVIAGFAEVDSVDNTGVEELKKLVAKVASGLRHMGELFSARWKDARDALHAHRAPRMHVSQFREICSVRGVDSEASNALSALLHELGYIIHYRDDEGLSDEVVLQPEWLTKAIGFVLEDRVTNTEQGVLDHSRLRDIWLTHGISGRETFDAAMHPYFLRLMEKFDVSYRLEGEGRSLVAQLVPAEQPSLPWYPDDDVPLGMVQIGLVCAMEEDPPGLIPWMIVRTHQFATQPRCHWQRGLFLTFAEHGTAYLELRGRELHLYVRAAWPNYFLAILKFILERLIGESWPGLAFRFLVPCPAKPFGSCRGRFPLDGLYKLKAQHSELPCYECSHTAQLDELLLGFRLPTVVEELSRIGKDIAALSSETSAYFRLVLKALTTETREFPRLFTLRLDQKPASWNAIQWGKVKFRLTLWCEYPGCQHPTSRIGSGGEGEYLITAAKEWLLRVAPYARFVARLLSIVVPVGAATVNATFDESLMKDVSPTLSLMKEVTTAFTRDDLSSAMPLVDGGRLVSEAEGASLRSFGALLAEVDPKHEWGRLRRVLANTGEYLWVCGRHYTEFDPGLPVLSP